MSGTRTTAERFRALRDELLTAAEKQGSGGDIQLARYVQAAAACQMALVSAVEHCDGKEGMKTTPNPDTNARFRAAFRRAQAAESEVVRLKRRAAALSYAVFRLCGSIKQLAGAEVTLDRTMVDALVALDVLAAPCVTERDHPRRAAELRMILKELRLARAISHAKEPTL